MKAFFKILFVHLLWLTHACSPLGEPVNEKKSDNHYYNRDKSDIQYSPMGNWFELANASMNADVESFEILTPLLSRDKNRVYFREHSVESGKVDLETFYVKQGLFMEDIGFDKNHVYAFEKVYGNEKDFAKLKIVEHADPKTYVREEWEWAKDKQNHFYEHMLIDVDFESFTNLNNHFSKDAKRVYNHYYQYFEPTIADVKSFQVLDNDNFAVDSLNVFSMTYPSENQTKLVAIARNPNEEIKLLSDAFIQIGERVFYRGTHLKGLNYQEMEIIENSHYIKDNNLVFYRGFLLTDADANTFGKIGKWEIGDKNGAYEEGKRIE